jgi:uncharacterized membrane protein YecN with MAPEG domain
MDAIHSVALYSGLNIIIVLALAVLVIRQRQSNKIALGDGGVASLALAIRAHANAVEYIPLALVGLAAIALAGGDAWVIHVGGLLLTGGRIAHGFGLSKTASASKGRIYGMLATLAALGWIAVSCILAFL